MASINNSRLCDTSDYIRLAVQHAMSAHEGDPMVMPRRYTRDELVERLVQAGELEVSGEDQDQADALFDTQNSPSTAPTASTPTMQD